jgi:ankyrin repeat protein
MFLKCFILLIIPALSFAEETLFEAATNGDVKFIKNFKGDINAFDDDGNTALILAVSNGNINSIKALLKRNPEIDNEVFLKEVNHNNKIIINLLDNASTEYLLNTKDYREIYTNNNSFSFFSHAIYGLRQRALNNDKKSFFKLADMCNHSDGAFSEGLFFELRNIFETNTTLFFDDVSSCPNQKFIIDIFINSQFNDLIMQRKKPSNFNKIKSLGNKSKYFIDRYEYLMKNPNKI